MRKISFLAALLMTVTAMTAQNRFDVNEDTSVNVGDISALYEYIINGEPQPIETGPKLYVHSDLAWDAYAMYVWASNGDVKDAWPGVTPTSTTTINNEEWMVFEMDEPYYTTIGTNWIINNNGGGSQYDLMKGYTFTKDTYVRVAADGSFKMANEPIAPDPTPDPTKAPSMYVHSDLTWSAYAMYVWASNGDVKDAWPGVTPTSTTTINDEEWMVFEMDEPYYTTTGTNWIINNNGGGSQYDLMQNYAFTADTYVRVSAGGTFTYSDTPDKQEPDPVDPGTEVSVTIDNTSPVSAKNRVIYEMNVGAFTSQGTLAAARQNLSTLRKLGIDIVWLMPIYPRGGGLNSPYAATDFKAVNPSYGTVNDLKNFVTTAHDLGMQVWLDWVPNHTATNARWVTEHPEYYVTQNGSIVHPNNYSDVYQLNYDSTATQNAMNDCLKYWIDQADIDGYRCDYISSSAIPASYWQSAIPMIKNYKSGKTITFLGEGDIVHEATRLSNVGFDYDYAVIFQGGRLRRFGNGTNASTLRGYLQDYVSESTSQSFGRMTYLTNHDVAYNDGGSTLASMYGDNKYALTVVEFTFFGMPLLYNGQEIGSDQKLDYFSDSKVSWSSVDAKMQNTTRALVALHHTQAALADNVSNITYHNAGNSSVLAYTKKSGNNEVLVIINLGTSQVQTSLSNVSAGSYVRWIDSSTIASGINAARVTLSASPSVTLEARGYAVYVKE